MQKKGLMYLLLNLVQKGVTKMKHTHTAFSYKNAKTLQFTISAELALKKSLLTKYEKCVD